MSKLLEKKEIAKNGAEEKSLTKKTSKFKFSNYIKDKREFKYTVVTNIVIFVIFIIFLISTLSFLYQDKASEDMYWKTATNPIEESLQEKIDKFSTNATRVQVGTYIEDIKQVDLKNSNFRVVMQIWFKWNGNEKLNAMENFRIYKGVINNTEVIKEYHKDGENYQSIRCDVTVTKNFWTRRFPLESHQLRIYIESNLPVDDIVFVNDQENSGYNSGLNISGYELRRHGTGVTAIEYDNSRSDPEIPGGIINSEHLTEIEINRESVGLYIKCFVALFGTILWVLIILFVCTYHKVDALSMIPGALFGAVSNIMVGANLVPDALEMGLLEFVNMYGIMIILAVSVSVICINRIRVKFRNEKLAKFYGRIMFATISILAILGNILYPIVSFMR